MAETDHCARPGFGAHEDINGINGSDATDYSSDEHDVLLSLTPLEKESISEFSYVMQQSVPAVASGTSFVDKEVVAQMGLPVENKIDDNRHNLTYEDEPQRVRVGCNKGTV